MSVSNTQVSKLSKEVSDKIGDDFFQSLVIELSDILNCDYGLIAEVDKESSTANILALSADGKIVDNFSYSLVGTPCADVSNTGVCFFPKDVQDLYPDDHILKEINAEAFVGIGLVNSNNECIGLLEVLNRSPIEDSEFKESMLRIFGSRASAEIERQRTIQALKDSESFYRTLFELGSDSHLLIDAENLSIIDCNKKAIEYLKLSSRKDLINKSVAHMFGVQCENLQPIAFAVSRLLPLRDTKISRVETKLLNKFNEEQEAEVTISPIKLNDKPHLLIVIRDLSEILQLMEQLKSSQEELQSIAYYDSLTSLPNRRSLHEKMDKLDASGERNNIFMMILDLDNFKEVNDSLGHYIGDQMLQKVSHRVETLIPDEATFYRLGGDEFAIVVTNATKKDVSEIAETLIAALEKPFNIADMDMSIGCSIGIANFSDNMKTTSELMRAADVAMYQAKNTTTQSYQFYDSKMDIYSRNRLQIISDFKPGLANDEFSAYYQPKINLDDMKVIGFEVLARWQHNNLGMIPPSTFIEIAEMSNNIKMLTIKILNDACATLKEWQQQGFDFQIAVNISARVLLDEGLIEIIDNIIAQYDIDPQLLEFEITESTLMKDPERALDIAQKITDRGITLSIDDFGTGYSSLSYLKGFPISSLKIDREFIRDMIDDNQDKIIVKSVIGLALNLGLKVVAEGIENEHTEDLLKTMNCHQAQGFLYSKPLPKSEITDWLENYNKQHM